MNFEEMIAELNKQNQQLGAEMQRLNTLMIKNQGQIELLGYLIDQEQHKEEKKEQQEKSDEL